MFSIFILLLVENVLSLLHIITGMEHIPACVIPVDLGIWLMVIPESSRLTINVGKIVVLWVIREWRSCNCKKLFIFREEH